MVEESFRYLLFQKPFLVTKLHYLQNRINILHNKHVQAIDNHHAVQETHFYQKPSVGVRVGIINYEVIGADFFNKSLNNKMYWSFFKNLCYLKIFFFKSEGLCSFYFMVLRIIMEEVFTNFLKEQ